MCKLDRRLNKLEHRRRVKLTQEGSEGTRKLDSPVVCQLEIRWLTPDY
jgi:hypothetical protein